MEICISVVVKHVFLICSLVTCDKQLLVYLPVIAILKLSHKKFYTWLVGQYYSCDVCCIKMTGLDEYQSPLGLNPFSFANGGCCIQNL